MYLIGITGLIGSGKTTVGCLLKELGFVVFDMDVWCRKMYQNPNFLYQIKQYFPKTFINNVFDKKILRDLVFSDVQQLQILESLTHPYLKNKFLNTIHQFRFNQNLFFIESALLYQMNLDRYCYDVLITKAPDCVMQQRVIKRDHIQIDQFNNIIDKQNKFIDISLSKHIINTNQSLTKLKVDLIELVRDFYKC